MADLTVETARQIVEAYGRTLGRMTAQAVGGGAPPTVEMFATDAAALGLEEHGFDWQSWDAYQDGRVADPEFVASADPQTLKRIMTTHLRVNRFVEGHLEDMHTKGVVGAVIARLTRLAADDAL